MTRGALLTIPEIQFTESPDGASPWNEQVIDRAGGVVAATEPGSVDKILALLANPHRSPAYE